MYMPIYVTRPDADGKIGVFALNIKWSVGILYLFLIHIIIWSLVGFVVAFRILF